jgi:hypothetical protein
VVPRKIRQARAGCQVTASAQHNTYQAPAFDALTYASGARFQFKFVFDLTCRLQFGATDQLSALSFEVES